MRPAVNLQDDLIDELTSPDKDAGYLKWQVFVGFNMQFKRYPVAAAAPGTPS